jgi:hypothetical protein
MGTGNEARIGSLVAAAGVIWTAHAATHSFTSLSQLFLPVGPLELCAVGALIWLHAKWRRSLRR